MIPVNLRELNHQINMLLLAIILIVESTEIGHSYNPNDEVILWFNRGVLASSPSDSYSFHDFPLCRGKRNLSYPTSLSNAISGIEPVDSGMDILYTQNSQAKSLCSKKMSQKSFSTLVSAIQLGLLAEFYLDGLPMWVDLGKATPDIYFFTTYHLTIHYNQESIIRVAIVPDDPVLIYDTETNSPKLRDLPLSYSVSWMPTEEPFSSRMNVYYETGLFSTSIHWYSLLNTTAIILVVCAVVLSVMYRTLSNDLRKYENEEVFDVPTGWKQMRSEVRRAPVFNFLFTGLVSIGCEVATVCIAGLMVYNTDYHGKEIALGVVISIAGYIGGFITINIYQLNKGFIATSVFAGCVLPTVIWIVLFLYALSGVYIGAWVLFAITCNIFLFYIGARYKPTPAKSPRIGPPIISKKSWLNEMGILIGAGGLLPFISIAIELHYFLASFLTYQFYYMYGFALISIAQVCICLGCVGIVISYLILNSEDHRWQWSSFLAGGSLGAYVWIYSIYFYLFRNGGNGVWIFAAHMAFVSLGVFVAAGAVAYLTARVFLHKLYDRIKSE